MNFENAHYIRYLEALKASPFFYGIDVEAIKGLLAVMSASNWPKGTEKNSAEATYSFHFIVYGRLKVYKINPVLGREHTVFMLGSGHVFDILQLLDGESHDIYWEAKDDMELLKINVEAMRKWIFATQGMQRNILSYSAARMRQLEDAATDISLHGTLVRLSKLLLKHINGKNHHLELINDLPHDEIPSLVGTTRAVVNRHIQELKRCGAITVKRKYIDVQNLQMLISIAEEKYMP